MPESKVGDRSIVTTHVELGSQNLFEFPDLCPNHGEADNTRSRNCCLVSYHKCNCHYEALPAEHPWSREFILLTEHEVLKGREVWRVSQWGVKGRLKDTTDVKVHDRELVEVL